MPSRGGLLAALVTAFVSGGLVLGPALAAQADDGGDSGTTITVTVRGSDRDSSTGSGTGSGLGSGSGAGGGSEPSTAPTDSPTSTATPLPTDTFDLGGIFAIGGLTSDYGWSANPFAGTVHVQFSVKNTTKATLSGSAAFWVNGPLGNQLGDVQALDVDGLAPGETRVVGATLPGIGQWTFVTAHAKFVPPKVVEGTKLSPITRDLFMFVMPWYLALGILVTAATVLVFLRFRMVRAIGVGTPA